MSHKRARTGDVVSVTKTVRKRGGTGPARPSTGLALTRTDAMGRRTKVYDRRPATHSSRLLEHKTFDATYATTGPVSMTRAFDSAGAVAATPFAPLNGSTTVSAWCLNQVPAVNANSTSRVGRRIANTAISLRGSIVPGTGAVDAIVGLVLVWDRNPNSGTVIPAFNAVFNSQAVESLTNKDNAPRFKILRRWTWKFIGTSAATVQTDENIQYFDEFVKMKNKITLFQAADTSGLLTAMVEGSLLLYALASNALTGATVPTLNLQTRLYFSDH